MQSHGFSAEGPASLGRLPQLPAQPTNTTLPPFQLNPEPLIDPNDPEAERRGQEISYNGEADLQAPTPQPPPLPMNIELELDEMDRQCRDGGGPRPSTKDGGLHEFVRNIFTFGRRPGTTKFPVLRRNAYPTEVVYHCTYLKPDKHKVKTHCRCPFKVRVRIMKNGGFCFFEECEGLLRALCGMTRAEASIYAQKLHAVNCPIRDYCIVCPPTREELEIALASAALPSQINEKRPFPEGSFDVAYGPGGTELAPPNKKIKTEKDLLEMSAKIITNGAINAPSVATMASVPPVAVAVEFRPPSVVIVPGGDEAKEQTVSSWGTQIINSRFKKPYTVRDLVLNTYLFHVRVLPEGLMYRVYMEAGQHLKDIIAKSLAHGGDTTSHCDDYILTYLNAPQSPNALVSMFVALRSSSHAGIFEFQIEPKALPAPLQFATSDTSSLANPFPLYIVDERGLSAQDEERLDGISEYAKRYLFYMKGSDTVKDFIELLNTHHGDAEHHIKDYNNYTLIYSGKPEIFGDISVQHFVNSTRLPANNDYFVLRLRRSAPLGDAPLVAAAEVDEGDEVFSLPSLSRLSAVMQECGILTPRTKPGIPSLQAMMMSSQRHASFSSLATGEEQLDGGWGNFIMNVFTCGGELGSATKLKRVVKNNGHFIEYCCPYRHDPSCHCPFRIQIAKDREDRYTIRESSLKLLYKISVGGIEETTSLVRNLHYHLCPIIVGKGLEVSHGAARKLFQQIQLANPKLSAKAARDAYNDGDMFTLYRKSCCGDIDSFRILNDHCEKGNRMAKAYLGILFHDDPRYGSCEKASSLISSLMLWMQEEAVCGNAHCQYILGVAYFCAIGAKKDPVRAFKYFYNSAEQLHCAGQSSLGICYSTGSGVERNDKLAAQYYQFSADQGYVVGLSRLAYCYAIGMGVPASATEAFKCCMLAAEQGFAPAQFDIGEFYLTGSGVPVDTTETVHYYRLAAHSGHMDACYKLGNCYSNGIGVSVNSKEAIWYYKMAADMGHADSKFILGTFYVLGQLVKKDLAIATRLLKQAMNLGHLRARDKLEDIKIKFPIKALTPVPMELLAQDYDENEHYLDLFLKAQRGDVSAFHDLCDDADAKSLVAGGYVCALLSDCEHYKDTEYAAFLMSKLLLEVTVDMCGRNKHLQFALGVAHQHGVSVKRDIVEAVRYLHMAADAGHSSAQYCIGHCYFYGVGVKKDYDNSFWYCELSAFQGNMFGLSLLGVSYLKGFGCNKNNDRAVECLRAAADMGHIPSKFQLGLCYEEGNGVRVDTKEAIRLYRDATENGFLEAQMHLARCYQTGTGTEADLAMAYRLYVDAASEGQADALFRLGCCCEFGIGVDRNIDEALRYYKAAADAGSVDGLHTLGYRYERGLVLDSDPVEAAVYYHLAAQQGHHQAEYDFGRFCELGIGLLKNEEQAFRYYLMAAKCDHVDAMYALGRCYKRGIGVPVNVEAVEYLRKAASAGHVGAIVELGHCYQLGFGVDKDASVAKKFYTDAAELKYPPAQCKLGVLYETGHGCPKNLEKAVENYRLAADQGDADAICRLGYCYEKGFGVPSNAAEGVRLYRVAAAQKHPEANFRLGCCAADGIGMSKDMSEGFLLLYEAVRLGYSGAQEKLDSYGGSNINCTMS